MRLVAVLVFTLLTALTFPLCLVNAAESHEKRAIGGHVIERGDWPWLVLLKAKFATIKLFGLLLSENYVYCGGSLISDRWIITAAHCFLENGNEAKVHRNWKARLATVEFKPSIKHKFYDIIGKVFNIKEMREWNIGIDKIIIHPGYNKSNMFQNDIALVKLSKNVPHSFSLIKPVPLPRNDGVVFPRVHQSCIIKGWGCTKNGGQPAGQARQVEMPVYPSSPCQNIYKIKSMETRICAGHRNMGIGVCQGDSGGPLVCQLNGKYMLAGVVSFTSKNNPESFPAVFTRVQSYIPWIVDVMYTYQ